MMVFPEHLRMTRSRRPRVAEPAAGRRSVGPAALTAALRRGPTAQAVAVVRTVQRTAGNGAACSALNPATTAPADPRPVLQRWDSLEHVALGDARGGPIPPRIVLEAHRVDLPRRGSPPESWPAPWNTLYERGTADQKRSLKDGLTYGEVVALSGDFYSGWDALNRAPLREIYDLIPLMHRKGSTEELQEATGGRYLALAEKNESHFTNVRPGHRNIDVWWRTHAAAIEAARRGDANSAWGQSAIADHFLTDAFSGGHVRVERKKLMDRGALGNVESKILHDLDNEHGVEVTNDRGDDPWIAYGDDFLSDTRNSRNKSLAEEAVRFARQDIADALDRRAGYAAPVAGTVFAAQRLVPRPVDPSRDRWTGRTPTYVIGPDGHPIRQPDDYTRTSNRVILDEGPGVIAGFWRDDNQVRSWISRQDATAIGRQSLPDRLRMMEVLMSGPTLDDDERSILKVMRGSAANGDHVEVVDTVDAWELMDDFHGAEERQLRAFYRVRYYGGTDRATAQKLIERCSDGWTSEWEQEMIADILEARSDRRALVSDIGRAVGGGASGAGRDFRNGLSELDSQVDGAEQDTIDRLFR